MAHPSLQIPENVETVDIPAQELTPSTASGVLPDAISELTEESTSEDSHTIAFLTLGCAKNEVDSRVMRTNLEGQGFVLVEDPEEADFIVVNTCAFIEAAIEESLDTILELAEFERVRSGQAHVVVVGCLPSRFGQQLTNELPEVSAFVSVAEEKNLLEVLRGLKVQKSAAPSSTNTKVAVQPWAYVKISDGCSRHCAYCTIPFIRGPYHNYPFEQIDADVSELVARGVREIILIGQDTGIWSEPTGSLHPDSLAQLLDVLAARYPHTWFRVMYLQPEGITDALLNVMAAHENIAEYLDIPLQHTSAKILKAMNRKGSGEEYLKLLERIRTVLPNVALRTTVMTGFPGETLEDFEQLCSFIDAACFDYVGIFAYSREDGTAAAELPDQVDGETALERQQILRDLADTVGFRVAQRHLDQSVDVLVCGQEEEGIFGRTQGQAPEVDGETLIMLQQDDDKLPSPEGMLAPGSIVHVRIVETVLYDLFAEVL